MKVEQILYTRMGGSELGAGWQSRKSDHFDAELERGCTYQFNCIVDGLLDKTKAAPDEIYAVWHSNRYICSSRAIKISDQSGRGNILAQAYVVNEIDYIQALSKPSGLLCINDFADDIIDNPPVLDALPASDAVSLRDICQKYSITADKMQQIVLLILSSVLVKSAQTTVPKRSLKIVVSVPTDKLYQAAREIMTAVYSFMPCALRLNTSFASYLHPKLEGLSVLFTNEKQERFFYDMETSRWDWPQELIISNRDMARIFVKNRANADFQRDLEAYLLQVGNVYALQQDNLCAGYYYSAIKNGIEFEASDDELFKAVSYALKDTRSGIQDEYITLLIKHYVNRGGKIPSMLADKLIGRYNKTKNEGLKEAIDYYSFNRYVSNYSEAEFSKFCALQKNAPLSYNNTIKRALSEGRDSFLRKVCEDVIKSRETYKAFLGAVSVDTKNEMFTYMVCNYFLREDGSGYESFCSIKKRLPDLYSSLHEIALSEYNDLLKKYYVEYYIEHGTANYSDLKEIRTVFGGRYDKKLGDAALKKALDLYTEKCRSGCSPDEYTRYKNTIQDIAGSRDIEEIETLENEGKVIFWKSFRLSSWSAKDSYTALSVSSYPASKFVSELDEISRELRFSQGGEHVYDDIISKVIKNVSLDNNDFTHIMEQFSLTAREKHNGRNADDMVLGVFDPKKSAFNTNMLAEVLVSQRSSVSMGGVARSPMLAYIIDSHLDNRQAIYKMYEIMIEKNKSGSMEVISGFKRLCEEHGISLRQVSSNMNQKSAAGAELSLMVLPIISVSAGLGLSALSKLMGSGITMGKGLLDIITLIAFIICLAVIAVPFINIVTMLLRCDKGKAVSVAIVMPAALMAFAMTVPFAISAVIVVLAVVCILIM